MAYYVCSATSLEAIQGGSLHFDTHLKQRISRNPDVFVDVVGGHRTVVVGAQAVIDITTSTMTTAQKRSALKALIVAEAVAMGIDIADEAFASWVQLLQLPTPEVPLEVVIRDA